MSNKKHNYLSQGAIAASQGLIEFSDQLLDTAYSPPYSKGNSKTSPTTKYVPCYESHPAMPLGERVIYGGSCSSPIVKDAEVYVALDNNFSPTYKSWPWGAEPIIEVYYPITDTKPPSDAKSFVKMIDWLAEQVSIGLKCHVGCIGGHGRTGTVLASLAKVMLGEDDAITYVRKHYCKKAVETESQIKFLGEHFGIKPVKATKTFAFTGAGTTAKDYGAGVAVNAKKFPAIRARHCLWGPKALPNTV